MATVGTDYVVIADFQARTKADGTFEHKMANRVARTNELIQYLPWIRGDKDDGNTVVQATKLPTVGYIKYNLAPTKSKGAAVQVTFDTGVLKTFSDIDAELVNSKVDKAGFRQSEDMLFVEAMNQQVASDIIYSNVATVPEKFNGLATLYAAPNTTRNNYGYYMLSGGGSGSDNTSIWLLSLGEDGVSGVHGKAGVAGLKMKDHSKVWGPDSAGNDMEWYRSEYRWEVGLQVKRPGAVVRICNIDVSAVLAESSAADLSKLIQRALGLIEPGLGRVVIACNRTMKTWFAIQAQNKSTLGLHTIKDTFGEEINAIQGRPIIQMDTITNAEATIAGTFQSDL